MISLWSTSDPSMGQFSSLNYTARDERWGGEEAFSWIAEHVEVRSGTKEEGKAAS